MDIRFLSDRLRRILLACGIVLVLASLASLGAVEAFGQAAETPAPPSKTWALAYTLTFLLIGLGLMPILRMGRRTTEVRD